MKTNLSNILFIHSGNETFVKLDREILSSFAKVQDFYAVHKFPTSFMRYWRGVKNSDLVFCWFASWNTFWALVLAKLFQKPSLLVTGGYDVANLPEAGYGNQRGGLQRWMSKWAMNLATTLLPFSYFGSQEAEKNAGISGARMRVVYIGVPDSFGELNETPRESMVLTVGKVDRPNLKRKGIEPFVRAAAELPYVQFVVIGAWADNSINYLRSIASPNVHFTGRVSDEELLTYYRQASVYVQASLHEGFGLSVAEAMLAGCIPVVTALGSLPEVVGNCGIYTDSINSLDLASAIEGALSGSQSLRQQARKRILEQFPLDKRKYHLMKSIYRLKDRDSEIFGAPS